MERRVGEVVGRAVLGVDLEPPRQLGRLAEELLVPPVADPADALREQQPRRGRVHEAEDAVAGVPHDHRAGEAAEEDPAPDAEPALPDGERRPPGVDRLNLVPGRDVVVQPRADDPEADAPDRDAEDEIPVAAAAYPADAGQPDARCDSSSSIRPYMRIASGPRWTTPVCGEGMLRSIRGILPSRPVACLSDVSGGQSPEHGRGGSRPRDGSLGRGLLEQDLQGQVRGAALAQQVHGAVQVDVVARCERRRGARVVAGGSSSSILQRSTWVNSLS